mmetsp:Transcript_16103/g.34843  ORF Transcript_16103/g.34843 Transcript_16103/m.34843 type:complete len:373 (+) Transcript_16103:124-1242(+)|eukprot:CAMPEP_0202899218 /NCGR_PEP_ID=MMETSP1392-20130828/7508_1 /ASSEMBLY_ACC=CAM_ASM_000868 /TAXON_ID=225041 /ORGANISM="Chlamydomonas chlamydogama, Strain SAG 11-48b" /LENGTH=372 /DNA_ID=CAMNT_0049585341 /DNA_START=104 /DNA_END=1222 /DNA_ORIENTATION=-
MEEKQTANHVLQTKQSCLQKVFHQPFTCIWNSGTAVICIAAFLFSLGALGVKLLAQHGQLPVFEVAFVPSVFCLAGTSALVYSSGHPSVVVPQPRIMMLTLLRGCLGAASLTLFYLSLSYLPLKDSVTLFFCSPAIAAVMEWLLMPSDSANNTVSIFGCLSTVVGVWLVSQPDCLQHSGTHTVGMLLALGGATANASAFIAVRMIGNAQSALSLTWWYHGCVSLVTLVPLLLKHPHAPVVPAQQDCLLLLAVSAIQFVGQILINRGFQLETATRGSAVNVLQVVFSYVWDLAVIKGGATAMGAVGAGLVICGVLAVALRKSAGSTSQGYDRLPIKEQELAAEPFEASSTSSECGELGDRNRSRVENATPSHS